MNMWKFACALFIMGVPALVTGLVMPEDSTIRWLFIGAFACASAAGMIMESAIHTDAPAEPTAEIPALALETDGGAIKSVTLRGQWTSAMFRNASRVLANMAQATEALK